MTKWWVVMVEGDEFPELFGPYKSEAAAQAMADQWNDNLAEGGDKAWTMPLGSPRDLLAEMRGA